MNNNQHYAKPIWNSSPPPRPTWNSSPPPRPTNPKPPQPMDVDKSIQSRQINYMNRPENNIMPKRFNGSDNLPRKQQRLFATNVITDQDTINEDEENPLNEEYFKAYQESWDNDGNNDDLAELNFTTEASLAYHT